MEKKEDEIIEELITGDQELMLQHLAFQAEMAEKQKLVNTGVDSHEPFSQSE